MKCKRILAALTVLASVTVLAGCGAGAGTTDSGSGAGSTTSVGDDGVTNFVGTDLASNPAQAANRKDTIVVGTEAPNGVFNYLFASGVYDTNISDVMFAHLNMNDEKGNLIEGLADLPELSEDKLTYTYKIKKDANWSDGTPITAKDVLIAINMVCDGSYDGDLDFITGAVAIKGAKEYHDGTATEVSGVQVVDDKTINITVNEPSSAGAYIFADIIPLQYDYYSKYYTQGNVEGLKDTFTNPGPASGSYKFVEYKPGEEVVLEANDKSVFGAPKTPNLIFKVTTTDTRLSMLQSGDIDLDIIVANADNVETVEDLGFLNYKLYPENGYGYIGLNKSKPTLKDPEVRRALMYGLDREKINRTVCEGYGEVINVPQAKASWSYAEPKNTYEFDPEKAKQILEDAGWKVGADGIREKDGVRLSLHYTASTGSKTGEALLAIAPENFKELGIEFSSDTMDFTAVSDKVKGDDWDMYSMGWSLGADPSGSKNVFTTGGPQNRGHYSNAKVDETYAKISQEFDKEKQKELYAELYNELNTDLPYIYINQTDDFYVYNGRLKNLEISPYIRYSQYLYKVSIEE